MYSVLAQDKARGRALLSSKVGLLFVLTFFCASLLPAWAQSQVPILPRRLDPVLGMVLSPVNCAVMVALYFLRQKALRQDLIYHWYIQYVAGETTDTMALIQAFATAARTRHEENRQCSLYRAFKGIGPRFGDEFELLTPVNVCESAAVNFVRMCHLKGIDARLCQMQRNGVTIHVLAEARLKDRWGVVDPIYGIVYHDKEGHLVPWEELRDHWDTYYKAQAHPQYFDAGYDFSKIVGIN
jgi:hypothetical protein